MNDSDHRSPPTLARSVPAEGPEPSLPSRLRPWLEGARRLLTEVIDQGSDHVVLGPSWLTRFVLRGSLADLPDEPGDLQICYRVQWDHCEALTRAVDEAGGRPLPPRRAPIPITAELRRGSAPLRVGFPWGTAVLLPEVPGLGGIDAIYGNTVFFDWAGLELRWFDPAGASVRRPLGS